MKKLIIGLATALLLLVGSAAQAHGGFSYSGTVNLNNLFRVPGGSGAVQYANTHNAVSGIFYLEQKRVSDSTYSVLKNSGTKSCINCTKVSAIITASSGQACVHNALYRIRAVHTASSHPTTTTIVASARVLC